MSLDWGQAAEKEGDTVWNDSQNPAYPSVTRLSRTWELSQRKTQVKRRVISNDKKDLSFGQTA